MLAHPTSTQEFRMRRAITLATAVAAALLSFAAASPVQAADATATCLSPAPPTSSVTVALGGSYTVSVGNSCAATQWTLTGGASTGSITSGSSTTSLQVSTRTNVATGDIITITNGGSGAVVNLLVQDANSAAVVQYAITFSGNGGGGNNNGGGGSPSSNSSSAPARALETLSLSVAASGASCTGGNPTGYSGTWMALPKSDDCKQSGPNAKAGAKLLGWSPNANFPVDVAQNQIAKSWGVYDGPIGGVRMIFIPAGMSTYVSGSNTLYPVWSA